MPAPTMALDGTMARVSYGEAQRLTPEGWKPIDLHGLASRHDGDAPFWSWLAAHGVARPNTSTSDS